MIKLQISESLSRRLKWIGIWSILYSIAYILAQTWQDIEYLTSQTFPTVYLAWVQLLQGGFLGLAILTGALALMEYVKDNQPVKEELAKVPTVQTA